MNACYATIIDLYGCSHSLTTWTDLEQPCAARAHFSPKPERRHFKGEEDSRSAPFEQLPSRELQLAAVIEITVLLLGACEASNAARSH